ncbi:MAG TPA: DUF4157 domain-containing protein [Thermoanaerobaculia bacterium]
MMKARLHGEKTVARRTAPVPTGGSVAVRQILHGPRFQAKLTVGAPDDAFEREADQVAGRVMRMTELGVQRMCHECEEEMQAKEEPGRTPSVPEGFEQRFSALQGGGRPLPASERAFFEPRFGRDFSGVRLHSGPAAGELARSVHARAFTLGKSIVLGPGESGRELLAHELTHVVQQRGAPPGVVRRQTIHSSCAGKDDVLHQAWEEGQRLAVETVKDLMVLQENRGSEMVQPLLQTVQNAFGDDLSFSLSDLIDRFRSIVRGFTAGRTLRCDTDSVKTNREECEQFSAFVIDGNDTDIFLCPTFFDSGKSVTERGVTLVHEMAHSVLRIGHLRGAKPSFSCDASLGLVYRDAIKNAYPYGILANCLNGEGSEAAVVTVEKPKGATAPGTGRSDSRWSLSGGVGLGAEGFAAALGSKISLRTGEFVVWNPTIGFNLLSLPAGTLDPSRVAAATADLGLRIQKPIKGFYFDISAGGFASFEAPAGLTGTAGLGVRLKRLELGAEVRALVPEADFDRATVVVFGRAALRFR